MGNSERNNVIYRKLCHLNCVSVSKRPSGNELLTCMHFLIIRNDPDFSRFAKKPTDALWSQFFTIPIGFAVTSFIGIIVSSSSTVIFNETIWSPLDLLSRFLDEGGHGTRAGVFFIAFAFSLAQLGTNIAANSVSAGKLPSTI